VTVTKIRASQSSIKELLSENREFLKALIQATLQELLKAAA
jgi:hypothetical protein